MIYDLIIHMLYLCFKASSNMLTAGAAAPAVKLPAPAVDPKIRHCWGQVMSSFLLK